MKVSRKLLVIGLLGLAVLAAGCQGTGGGNAAPGEGTGSEEVSADGPRDVPKGEECPVCGMMPHRHSEWNAQLVFGDGEAVYFDVPKDALTYYLNADEYFPEGKTQGDVSQLYFTDYYTTEFVPMDDSLYFVKGSDVTGPMGRDLVPVQGRSEAETFARDHGGTVYAVDEVTPEMVSELKGGMEMSGEMSGASMGSMESGAESATMNDSCPVCNMMPAKYPAWEASIVFEDGEKVYVDAPKHAWEYYLNPGKYGDRTQDEVSEVYFTDYSTVEETADGHVHKEFVAMSQEVYFVNGSDVMGSMGPDLIPFEGRTTAEEFAADHGGEVLSKEEVTGDVVDSLGGGMDMDGNSSMDMGGMSMDGNSSTEGME